MLMIKWKQDCMVNAVTKQNYSHPTPYMQLKYVWCFHSPKRQINKISKYAKSLTDYSSYTIWSIVIPCNNVYIYIYIQQMNWLINCQFYITSDRGDKSWIQGLSRSIDFVLCRSSCHVLVMYNQREISTGKQLMLWVRDRSINTRRKLYGDSI